MPVAPVELSIVIPTYNERGNIAELARRVVDALPGVEWEIIFVDDDSPDGTVETARELYADHARVRCIRRLGRRGLSSACIEGMLSSSARYLAVMDADLQHDPGILAQMLSALRANEADLVIGSRYIDGGSVGQWQGQRVAISRFATTLARVVLKQPVSDPMSGFFMLTRATFENCVRNLSALGFKILVDLIASSKSTLRIKEIPFTFGVRHAGESKLSGNVVWEYLLLLADKLVGKYVPVRFVAFGVIGAVGVGVHFLVLTTLFKPLGLSFAISQAVATVVAMTFNFTVNNFLTYAGQSLHGAAWLRGLVSFILVCSVGALANVGVANYLFGHQTGWQLAALAGIVLGAVWNYAVSARYTWKATK